MNLYYKYADRALYPAFTDQMFRARADVFSARLQWNVTVKDGWEIDVYDEANPLYVMSVDDSGVVGGSLRVLPTTGPDMLRDIFAKHFDADVDFQGPLIWECTRFCIHPNADRPKGYSDARAVHAASAELMAGLCDVALRSGIQSIIGVFDERMIRYYGRTGWEPEVIASSDAFATGRIHVGLWEVSENEMEKILTKTKIKLRKYGEAGLLQASAA